MNETTRDNIIDLMNENTRLKDEIERLRGLVKTHEDWRKVYEQQCDNYDAEIERLREQLDVFAGDAESIADDAKTLALLIRAALGTGNE